MRDSEKMLSALGLTKNFKHEETEMGKISRRVIRICREFRKIERQEELTAEAKKALRNFARGKITKEELDLKFLPLEAMLNKAAKKAMPKAKRLQTR
ncbi:MAG: hypothetical protein FJ115_04800 [Deltaproteobacteria bacterium]|nr:hypothetical protein [Deltaproteobacteria bacterium]MBM4322861.1 hypothetical protein [Deltaproteobacteria bacterium]MBM4347156.1 hypothetical protein [Deltaproteobacteria bacterium]